MTWTNFSARTGRSARVPGCAASVRHAPAGVHCPRPASRCGLASGSPIAAPPSRPARGRGAGTLAMAAVRGSRLGGAAAQAGTTPWLQFWLQFTGVRGTPGGFTCPGQDAGGPA